MKKWISSHRFTLAGALLGGVGGFLYWRFVGCTSGTCMITSRPVNSVLYFSLLGALLFSMLTTSGRSSSPNNT
ncbi:MAG: hypothetical protein ACKO6K_10415 [Chitinophagaceae bacterium]